ncbi:TPA: ISL3 family transposase [Enterococcus faecium]|nr:ISL3 family transposase [Enterococcus faecium]
MDNHTRKLLGLTDKHLFFDEEWLIEKEYKGVQAQFIKGRLDDSPSHCEHCGSIRIIRNGSYTTRTQILKVKEKLTILELKRTRFLCYDCGQTFSAKTDLVDEHHQLTKELKQAILMELYENQSRKLIAKKYFVSDGTVTRILREATKHYQPRMNFLPTVLCMDEFKSMKSVSGSMSFICVDGTTHQLFTILEDRRLYKLTQYFLHFPRKARLKVKYLVMDMNASYCQLLKTVFPNAEIVTDRFHIVQHINRSFNQLRVQIMNRFRTSHSENQKKYRRLKRYWKLLLKDSTTLEPLKRHYHRLFKRPISQTEIVDELLSYNEELRTAYHFCQLLRYYFVKRGTEGFQETLKTISSTLPQSFKKKFTIFHRYQSGISNAFKVSHSNGVTEGLNNKIKLIKRIAFGYRNFYNFRARIYLQQGLIFEN